MNLKAIFPAGATELTVNGLHQWDYGRKLDIHAPDLPAIVEVHFACPGMDEAIVRVGSAAGGVVTVAIPDRCLEQSSPVTAWVYEVGETYGQTIKTLTLNIMTRTRPQTAEALNPETSDKYTEAVGAMNETVETLKNGDIKVKKADQATEAVTSDNLCTYEIDSLVKLEELIKSEPKGSFGIRIAENINIEGVGTLPKWGYGYLVIAEGDAALNLVGIDGAHITAYYNSVFVSTQPWTIRDRPREADHAEKANRVTLDDTAKDANRIVGSPGLYCVTVQASSGSGILTTHLLSVEDLTTTVRSASDVNNVYVKYDGTTGGLSVSGGEGGDIISFIKVMYYDF